MSSRARLSLDLDASTKADFERVRAENGIASLTDLVKRAIRLLDQSERQQREGGSVIFRDRDGKERRVILL